VECVGPTWWLIWPCSLWLYLYWYLLVCVQCVTSQHSVSCDTAARLSQLISLIWTCCINDTCCQNSWPIVLWKAIYANQILFKKPGVCPMLSLTLFQIFLSKRIWMNMTFRVTPSHNWACTYSHFSDNGPQTYWGHELDLSRSRDVFGRVTNWFATCHFISVSHWNRVSIFNSFSRYLHPNISGSWPWPFMVTWRYRPRDHFYQGAISNLC